MANSAQSPADPLVSVLMVARDAAAHIDAAIRSARRQTLAQIEIVVVDDRSQDGTAAIIARHAAEDPRVIPVRGHGKGLSAVRNLSIAAAAAPFGAVLDADDILHPRHVEQLFDLATRTGAELAAANMLSFSAEEPPALFAAGADWQRERMIGHGDFLASGRIDRQARLQLGYLKPLLRLDALRSKALTYDLRLRIGEDWDLVERALASGLRYAFRPEPTYFYRRHPGSTSFRWKAADLAALIQAERDRIGGGSAPSALAQARRERLASLEDALAHLDAVDHLKARRVLHALPPLLRRPRAIGLLGHSAREGLGHRLKGVRRQGLSPQPLPAGPHVLVCGRPRDGSAVAIAVALIGASGVPVQTLTRSELADPLVTARAGQGAAMVLLADATLADAAAYAIGDRALFVAAGDVKHPLVDLVITPQTCGALLGLLPPGAQADRGLDWLARRDRAAGIAA
jgi:succinoglycan biosynthesis protein ExoO